MPLSNRRSARPNELVIESDTPELAVARTTSPRDRNIALVGAFRLEMKDAIAAVRLELSGVRLEMHDADAALRQEMRNGIATLRQDNEAARFEC